MNKYKNGKIYCIKSPNCDLVYIGSTIKKLKDRFSGHKYEYKMGYNKKSGEILQYGDCYIELIKEFPCNSKKELHREEGRLQLEMDCVNHYIAGRSNKKYLKEYNKQYHQKNKESILKRKREKIKCDNCGLVVQKNSMPRHKRSMKCKNHSGI